MAVQVDLAVNIVAVFGLSVGLRSLHKANVPLPVVQRVLIRCGPRRGADAVLPFNDEPTNRHS